MDELYYWIALTFIQGVGPIKAKKLISVFKNPTNIFKANKKELCNIDGIGIEIAKEIKDFKSWDLVERCLKLMMKEEIKAVHLNDALYPEMLKFIENPPIVVYYKGRLDNDCRYAIGIVGSRKPTHYGISMAERISEDLSSMGFTIVSGMARGIDSCAHKGAIRVGGRTIAVFGSGINVPYPPENRCLMDKIIESGCVMSEYPPDTLPDRENFPKRNRLISGLSLGVIVVEATMKSGALITAELAIEQGREVFAVPGNVNSENSKGTNELIKKGAILIRDARDVVEELAPSLKGFIRTKEKVNVNLTDEEKILCSYLSGEPKHVDLISREAKLNSSKVLSLLLELELKGLVKQIPGKRFYLA